MSTLCCAIAPSAKAVEVHRPSVTIEILISTENARTGRGCEGVVNVEQ